MTPKNDFIGTWRIIEMDGWDSDTLDLAGPATLTISRGREGTMTFSAVELWIDYRIGTRDGLPAIEFSFQGYDDDMDVCGRVWAVLEGSRLRGRLFFHRDVESSLVAERMRERKGKTRG